jgi:RNA polymerase sigma-70 factor (ECF subfamily)
MGEASSHDSFAEVHDSNREKILSYLHRMTRDRPLAEELTQETFLRASKALPSFRGEAKVSTWLYRIATNLYLDWRKAPGGGAAPELLLDPEELTDTSDAEADAPRLPDQLFEDSEMGKCVREFVDELPADHRAVIVLHDLEGLKNREIAEIVGCSLETVKIRIHRARRVLRETLTEGCDFYQDDRSVLRCDRKQGDCSSS